MPALDNHPGARYDLAWCAALWLMVLMVLLLDASGADAWFTRLYGSAQGFAWRNHWLTSNVMHQGGRWTSWVLFGIVIVAVWRPWPAVAQLPANARVVACLHRAVPDAHFHGQIFKPNQLPLGLARIRRRRAVGVALGVGRA